MKWVFVILFITALLGCSSVPFAEGDAQIQVNAKVAQFEIARSTISGLSTTTQTMPDYLKTNPVPKPVAELDPLRTFLTKVNCTKVSESEKDRCYQVTVMYLIKLANRYDDVNDQLYGAKVTVHTLNDLLQKVHELLVEDGPNFQLKKP